jgi:hypothetical protein
LFWFFSPKVSNKVNKSTGNLKLLLDWWGQLGNSLLQVGMYAACLLSFSIHCYSLKIEECLIQGQKKSLVPPIYQLWRTEWVSITWPLDFITVSEQLLQCKCVVTIFTYYFLAYHLKIKKDFKYIL